MASFYKDLINARVEELAWELYNKPYYELPDEIVDQLHERAVDNVISIE